MDLFLFSGGQDSVTSAAYMLDRFNSKEAHFITFDYGQLHSVEIDQARYCMYKLEAFYKLSTAVHKVLDVRDIFNTIGGSALTNKNKEITAGSDDTLPSSFVPGRNLIFLSIAAGYAAANGIKRITTGVCQTDYSGYPDCRSEFINVFNHAAHLALDHSQYKKPFVFTPMMWINKAQTWQLACSLGPELFKLVQHSTHTCYKGIRTPNQWGAGCGECPACTLREQGYKDWKAEAFDPLPRDLFDPPKASDDA